MGCRLGVGGCSIQRLGVGWSVGQQRWSCVATLTLTLSYSTPPPFTLLQCQLLSFSRSYNPKYPFTIVLRLPLYKHHILPPLIFFILVVLNGPYGDLRCARVMMVLVEFVDNFSWN